MPLGSREHLDLLGLGFLVVGSKVLERHSVPVDSVRPVGEPVVEQSPSVYVCPIRVVVVACSVPLGIAVAEWRTWAESVQR